MNQNKRIQYLGKQYHSKCEMCQTSKTVQNIYSLLQHPAIIKLLDNKNYMRICRKCAERETGKKTIKELHELEKTS